MNNCTLTDLEAFTTACDNMAASKYILVDKRLGDVLKSIAQTRQVFNIISECMVNFNFEKELTQATSKLGQFIIPEETHRCIAFIFCLLNLLDDKKINFSQFLNKYFSTNDDGAGPYANFCNRVVKVFKNVIVTTLVGEVKPSVNEKQEQEKKQLYNFNPELLDRLQFLTKDLKSYVHGLKTIKKSKCTRTELIDQITALSIAIDQKQVVFLKPLLLGIKYSIGKERELARRLIEINDIIDCILDARSSDEQL